MNWFEGKVIAQNGQRYTCLGGKIHTSQLGEKSLLIRWQSLCATCGKSFEAGMVEGGKASFSRRCQKHKKPGIPARRKRA